MAKKKALIMSILNQKGGVGKTTIATNLAHGLQLKGVNVLLADGDPQATARKWHEANDAMLIPCLGMDRVTLAADLNAVSSHYDLIIIDGAPQITRLSALAIGVSDVILIPVQPSDFDIWSTVGIVDLIKHRREVTDGTPLCAFIISRLIKNTKLSREIGPDLTEFEIPILESTISQRVAYIEAGQRGESVFCDGSTLASAEFSLLVDEVISKYLNI